MYEKVETLQSLGELTMLPKETGEFQGFWISYLYLRDPRDPETLGQAFLKQLGLAGAVSGEA